MEPQPVVRRAVGFIGRPRAGGRKEARLKIVKIKRYVSLFLFALQRAAFKSPLQRGAFLLIFFLIVFIILWTFISSILFLRIIKCTFACVVLALREFFCGF